VTIVTSSFQAEDIKEQMLVLPLPGLQEQQESSRAEREAGTLHALNHLLSKP
jgi:hypothetical protein